MPVAPETRVGVDLSHRHLGHVDPTEARLADVIVLDHHHRRVGDDSLLTASNDATLDHTHAPMQREGDVDALGERSLGRLDRAVGDADVAAPHVDPVHRRIAHLNAVQEDVMGLVDVDPVLATLDRDAANDDMVGADDDAAANDGSGLADERLRPIEQERPLMDTCGEVDRWRERCPADCPGDNECAGSSHERSYADLVELAATFGVRKREDRESCLGEYLCEQPCHPKRASAPTSGGVQPRARTRPITSTSSRSPSGRAIHPG